MPKISVIVPIYNVDEYLTRCIESILNQTFIDFECILVDDGSIDNCGKICDEYAKKDNRIKVIHKQNGGLSDARNAGLSIVEGDYITFVDGDDYIDQELLERLNEIVINRNTEVIVYGYKRIDYAGRIVGTKSFSPAQYKFTCEKDLFDFINKVVLTYKCGWSACGKLFKTSIISEANLKFYDNSKIYAEDLFFFLCYLLNIGQVDVISDTSYNYVIREGSITISKKVKQETKINEYVNLNVEFYKYIKEKGYALFLKKYYFIFYMIMNNMSSQSNRNYILSDIIRVDNKHFLNVNLLKIIANAKKISNYFGNVNKNGIIYENMEYLLYSKNTVIARMFRGILRRIKK